jgi:hypothetical protein
VGLPRCRCNSQGIGNPRWGLSNLTRLFQEARSVTIRINHVGLCATQRKGGMRQRRQTAGEIDGRANLASPLARTPRALRPWLSPGTWHGSDERDWREESHFDLEGTLNSLLPGSASAYLLWAMKLNRLPAGFVISAQSVLVSKPPSGAD